MSNFLNILYEGEQADAYRARKAKEQEDLKNDDSNYLKKRWKETNDKPKRYSNRDRRDMEGNYYSTPGKKMTKQNPNYGIRHPIKTSKGIKKDDEMYNRVDKKFSERRKDGIHDKHVYNSSNTKADIYRADDARYRHARRHPEQYKESVIKNPDLI